MSGGGVDTAALEAACEQTLAEREQWYDAMGDDEATAPSEAQEREWMIAAALTALLSERQQLLAVKEAAEALLAYVPEHGATIRPGYGKARAALRAALAAVKDANDQQSDPALETLDWSIGDSPQLLQERADRAKAFRDKRNKP
jgi:hypothetical protein